MRVAWCIVVLAGCDKLFGIDQITATADAPTPIDAVPIDAGPELGCSDGTREGFVDPAVFRSIAACSGAWRIPGLRPDPPVVCQRRAGNTGADAIGMDCSATDLCAAGWHVCRDYLEVFSRLPTTDRTCGRLGAAANTFFATAQSGPGGSKCNATGTDDVFGCGTYGLKADPGCAPLDLVSDNMCFTIKSVGGWNCPDPGSEVTTMFKTDPTAGGGVLCCRDQVQL